MYNSQSQIGAMAQLDGVQKYGDNPRTTTIPTIEQLLQEGEASMWSPSTSPKFGKDHNPEEDRAHPQKKSVLTKVKEKAKKLRYTLSKKKHTEDNNTTPSCGVTLEEDEDEDPEYFGAPMYESELAPEGYKETARQHPRAVPVISDEHVLANIVKPGIEDEKEKPSSPNKTLTKSVTEKLAPAYATVSDATHAIVAKIQGLTVSSPTTPETDMYATPETEKHSTLQTNKHANLGTNKHATLVPNMTATLDTDKHATLGTNNYTTLGADKYATLRTNKHTTKETDMHASPGEQVWDKGVSVKEYLMHKLEPGEDERALSQVIVNAMSPRRSPGDVGVVEKVKEAVTSLLWSEEPSQSTVAHSATNSSSHIPISTNAHEVIEEENHGRILQAN